LPVARGGGPAHHASRVRSADPAPVAPGSG
jgi:hypothetical protein